MKVKEVQKLKCDNCEKTYEVDKEDESPLTKVVQLDMDGWEYMMYVTVMPTYHRGVNEGIHSEDADLCPTCCKKMFKLLLNPNICK
jgi:transposase-like protein